MLSPLKLNPVFLPGDKKNNWFILNASVSKPTATNKNFHLINFHLTCLSGFLLCGILVLIFISSLTIYFHTLYFLFYVQFWLLLWITILKKFWTNPKSRMFEHNGSRNHAQRLEMFTLIIKMPLQFALSQSSSTVDK